MPETLPQHEEALPVPGAVWHVSGPQGSFFVESAQEAERERGLGKSVTLFVPLTNPENSPRAELEKRLAAHGMLPFADILKPFGYDINPGFRDIAGFQEWLEAQAVEYLHMRLDYETGHRADPEMQEWTFAHASAYTRVLHQLNYALGLK